MGLKLAAAAAGMLAFAAVCPAHPAAADFRLAAGLAGLGKRASSVDAVAFFGYGRGYRSGSNRGYRSGFYRGYRPHRGYRGPRRRHYRGFERYGTRKSYDSGRGGARKGHRRGTRRGGSKPAWRHPLRR